MEVVIKNQALRAFFDDCAAALLEMCPELCKILRQHVRDHQGALRQKNAMSPKGNFMLLGCMPQFMYAFIREQAQKRLGIDDIWRDQDNIRQFFKSWKECEIKRESKYGLARKTRSTSPFQPSSSARTVLGT